MAGSPGKQQTVGNRFFDAAGKRGEVQEFKEELNHSNKEKKKEALKKVIQAMTAGSDVSSLFPDVVNCMQTQDLPLKKLVYLYVINYAKSQPDLAILAIHSFRKDANDSSNQLLRALAVRTMGCIRLEQMIEYLLEPLRRACKDQDPYVRKTAAICIAKLFDINPVLVEDQNFIAILKDMLGDQNPMVVGNTVAALCEISTYSGRDYLNLNQDVISKIIPALDNTDWNCVFILDALSQYDPPDSKTAEYILEHGVTSRLSSSHEAVVLSAVKVMMKFMERINSPETVRQYCKKITPPLVTLLSSAPEIQYVVMRNINLIVQRQPQILNNDVRMFVCKYNDPLYVKLEKIMVMVQLASERNVDQILSEFREYATEVDIEVVRKSVRAIGQCAIKLGRAAERCVDALLDLIKSKVNYVVQEAIVVIRDIFRKYPGKYEMIIGDLCENLDNLDEPEAKAAMIWIVGEYADKIEGSSEILDNFIELFHEESTVVQLQLLTATVKAYLQSPSENSVPLKRILHLATSESANPDLRDRGFMYWRLLSEHPEDAKRVILSDRPTISDESFATPPNLLEKLIGLLSTLASVYHQDPRQFLDAKRTLREQEDDEEEDDEEDEEIKEEIRERARQQMIDDSRRGRRYVETEGKAEEDSDSAESDLSSDPDEGLGGEPPPPLRPISMVLPETKAGQNGNTGLKLAAEIIAGPGGKVGMKIMVMNLSQQPLGQWAVQFQKNPFGLAPGGPLQLPDVPPNGQGQTVLPIIPGQLLSGTAPTNTLYIEVALRTSLDIFYFSVPFDLYIVMTPSGPPPAEQFKQTWGSMPVGPSGKMVTLGQIQNMVLSPDMCNTRCKQYYVYPVPNTMHTAQDGSVSLYYSCKTANGYLIYAELKLQRVNQPPQGIQLTCASQVPPLVPPFQAFMSELLRVRWQQ